MTIINGLSLYFKPTKPDLENKEKNSIKETATDFANKTLPNNNVLTIPQKSLLISFFKNFHNMEREDISKNLFILADDQTMNSIIATRLNSLITELGSHHTQPITDNEKTILLYTLMTIFDPSYTKNIKSDNPLEITPDTFQKNIDELKFAPSK